MDKIQEYIKIKNVDTHLNFSFHALILFTFLTLFYFMYIVGLTKKLFKHEIDEIMEKALSPQMNEIKKDENVSKLLSMLPLDDIQEEFSTENKTVHAINNGITHVVTSVNIFLWLILIIVVIILKSTCQDGCGLHLSHIIIENILIFILIGSVEFLFFKFIASKYVPVPPSFMTTYFLQNIQEKL